MNENKAQEIQAKIIEQLNSEEVKKAAEERLARMEAEYEVEEDAVWFGETSLGEEIERELPRYLRREFGETLFDDDSLKANDLKYLGAFQSANGDVEHFWLIPSDTKEVYARVVEHNDGITLMDWGSERPPK